MAEPTRVVLVSARPPARVCRALEDAGYLTVCAEPDGAVRAVDERTEAVIIAAPRAVVMPLARRLKTRFQMPLLPVLALVSRPARVDAAAPDVWLPAGTRPSEIVERVDELVRIRRAEREMVRLSTTLAELAAENGRLYERARRDAEATALLLRELQHRVRNNLAAIQALLVLERHRAPPRPLPEALDVAIARLRSMAALQDSLLPHANRVELSALARAVAGGALEVFGAAERVQCRVDGEATLPARSASAIAIVLNELITNALKHAGAESVHVAILPDAETVALEVADDGAGMPAHGGDGSGLTIVRAVVRNELGGTMSYAPTARGTRVRIDIPLATAMTGETGD